VWLLLLQPYVLFEIFYKLAVMFLLYQIWQSVKR
jgi:hypothetical protein